MLWILFSCCFVFPLFSVWRFWSFELDLHETYGHVKEYRSPWLTRWRPVDHWWCWCSATLLLSLSLLIFQFRLTLVLWFLCHVVFCLIWQRHFGQCFDLLFYTLLPDLASSFWPYVLWTILFLCRFCYFIVFCLIWQYILNFHVSKGISYTTLREEFRKYVKPFVNDIAKYGTHSIKSGAASNPACKNISADLLDMHAGWKCATSKHRYIKRSVNDRLNVSRSIGFLLFAIIYLISSLGGGLKSCLARPRFPIRFFPQGF